MSEPRTLPPNYMVVPPFLNMATLAVDRHVEAGKGGAPAILDGERTITYAELQRLLNRWGNALKDLGFKKGDHFIIRAANCLEYYVAVLGGMKIGAVPIPTNTLFRSKELRHIITNSESIAVISTPELVGPIDEVRRACPSLRHTIILGAPKAGQLSFSDLLEAGSERLEAARTSKDDLAFSLYTSGTTGDPKGVQHAHRWLIGSGDPICHFAMDLRPSDICFQPQEISFMYPFGNNFFYPLYSGACIVMYAGRFEPERTLAYIQRYRVTIFSAVPTIYRMLLAIADAEKRYDLSSVRLGNSAGEPLPQDTYEEVKRRFGFETMDGIGQTELHIFLSNYPGLKVKPGAMGKPMLGHTVAVLNDKGEECPAGEVGELCLRADDPGLTLGYRKMEDRWQAVNKAGWYYCKDYAYRDEDGYYWYVSRSDDIIVTRAYLVSPKEVEEAIMDHPAVLEAGVVGLPDPTIGQKIKAFITLKPSVAPSGALAEEIKAMLKEKIAPYKAPREIEFVSELPKTATGKILRRMLRQEQQA
ncbi:MAG: benzoate-CoA ligase family protein [Candidatus Tectomicrobia bacterium]|nr:benzoate-CoA ligase family protein [Candidatus Tectomicrobia bacterium]